jgi:hypothetical protein
MSVRRTVPPPPDTQRSLEIVPQRKHACRWRRLVESTSLELETVRAEVAELRAARDAADANLAAALDLLIEYERGPVGRVVPLSREVPRNAFTRPSSEETRDGERVRPPSGRRSTTRARNGAVEKKTRSRSRSTA